MKVSSTASTGDDQSLKHHCPNRYQDDGEVEFSLLREVHTTAQIDESEDCQEAGDVSRAGRPFLRNEEEPGRRYQT